MKILILSSNLSNKAGAYLEFSFILGETEDRRTLMELGRYARTLFVLLKYFIAIFFLKII